MPRLGQERPARAFRASLRTLCILFGLCHGARLWSPRAAAHVHGAALEATPAPVDEEPCSATARRRSAWCESEGRLDAHISFEQIRRGQGLCLDGHCYDYGTLRAWLQRSERLPHNRARFPVMMLDALFGLAPTEFLSDGNVLSVDFGTEGRVLTSSSTAVAQIFSVVSGRELLRLVGHTRSVYAARFSPDWRRVLSGSRDHTARLWDAKSGDRLQLFRGHADAVTAVAFHPWAEVIATSSRDGTVRVWDSEAGHELARGELQNRSVGPVAFSRPAGDALVVGFSDGMVEEYLWAANFSEPRRRFQGHPKRVNTISISDDGKRILTTSHDKTARLWDSETAKELTVLRGHEGVVFAGALSPDGSKAITSSSDFSARLWSAHTGMQLKAWSAHQHWVVSVAFSPDGQEAVTGTYDGIVQVFNTSVNTSDYE